MKLLFDTNILIDYLNQIPSARAEITACLDPAISVMTWMEVLAGAGIDHESVTRHFLDRFQVLPLTPEVAELAVLLRRGSRRKLPDAIIWATAQETSRVLVTRNTRDFPEDDPGIHVPYRL